MPRAAKSKSRWVVLLLAALLGSAAVARASIPPPERWPALLEPATTGVLEPAPLEPPPSALATSQTVPTPAAVASPPAHRFRLLEGLRLPVRTSVAGARSFRLFADVAGERPVFGHPGCPYPALPRLETRLRASRLVGWEQRLENTEFSLEIAVGEGVGPSLYAFALNNPINFRDPMGLESLGEAIERYAVDAYAYGRWWQKGLGLLLQTSHAAFQAASAGAVGKIDRSQEALDRAEITRGQYWKRTGTAVGAAAASYAVGGAAGAGGARLVGAALGTRALTVTGRAAVGAVSGAAGGVGGLAGADAVAVAAEVQEGFSSTTDYLSAAAGGAAAGSLFGALAIPRGIPENARYSQRSFRATFSDEGLFGGRTVANVAAALKSGKLSPTQVPINYIVRDGNTLILNTRSAQALEAAGIPRSRWSAIDQTGDPFFEDLLTGQLLRNRLTSEGISTVRRSGGG